MVASPDVVTCPHCHEAAVVVFKVSDGLRYARCLRHGDALEQRLPRLIGAHSYERIDLPAPITPIELPEV